MDIAGVGTNIDASRGASSYSIASSQYYALVARSALGHNSNAGYARDGVRSVADALKAIDGWQIRGDWNLSHYHIVIAEKGSALAMIEADDYDGHVGVEVFSSKGGPDAKMHLASIMEKLPAVPPVEGDSVEVFYWTNTSMGPRSYLRSLEATSWKDIEGNYPTDVRQEMDDISDWTIPEAGGKLILAHGPAGTGKTTAIRTIARSWKSWCSMHCIVDPEEFFGDASYMISVLLGGESSAPVGTKDAPWRMIVVEDCDELITANAKERSGQQVARLLNVCDGMVGQGLRILLFLTTNEPVNNFHEAIVRPGRCLKNLYFGPLDAKEADAWRSSNGLAPTGDDATLAQLYLEHRERIDQNIRLGKRLR